MLDRNLRPVDCRGSFPEHLFGLQAAELPPPIVGWMLGLTPYYQRAGITIFRGDCKRILPLIPSSFFDLVVSDPPYGIAYDTNADGSRPKRGRYRPVRGDNRPFDPSHLLCHQRLCLWGANYYAHLLPRSTRWIIWDKREGRGQNCGSDCELAWTKGLPGVTSRTFYHMWNGACRASERNDPRLHPTQKPIALMRWCIALFPGIKTLVDPYMGVGTTLVAAKQLGLAAIGIEWDEQYCRAAADRVEATGKLLN
ncbi:MAG TPA: DNA methyltransferase [Phycisphaerae bacterium]|nr:DNA methyltransferase [Phycisphaerae bacterium]